MFRYLYITFGVKHNDKDPKFKVCDQVKISKHKNNFEKSQTPIWSKKVFVIKKLKITAPLTYVINPLYSGEIVGTCYVN